MRLVTFHSCFFSFCLFVCFFNLKEQENGTIYFKCDHTIHPGIVGNIAMEDKEKSEVLNAFFTSIFNSQTSYPQITQPPDLEVWDGKQLGTLYCTWTVTGL